MQLLLVYNIVIETKKLRYKRLFWCFSGGPLCSSKFTEKPKSTSINIEKGIDNEIYEGTIVNFP